VIAIADGEGVGDRILERDLVPGEVPHRLFGLGRNPVVPQPAVPGFVVAVPREVEVTVGLVSEVIREQVPEVGTSRIRLLEDVVPVRVREDLLVTEAPDSPELPEIVVEGPVLLHEDHHVLHIGDGPAPAFGQCLGRGRAAARTGESRTAGDAGGCGRRSAERRVLQETPTGDPWHDRLAGLPH